MHTALPITMQPQPSHTSQKEGTAIRSVRLGPTPPQRGEDGKLPPPARYVRKEKNTKKRYTLHHAPDPNGAPADTANDRSERSVSESGDIVANQGDGDTADEWDRLF